MKLSALIAKLEAVLKARGDLTMVELRAIVVSPKKVEIYVRTIEDQEPSG